jgi:hypothetical protein
MICAVCHQPHPQDRPLDAEERVACFRAGYHRLEQEIERLRAKRSSAEEIAEQWAAHYQRGSDR